MSKNLFTPREVDVLTYFGIRFLGDKEQDPKAVETVKTLADREKLLEEYDSA